MRTDAHQNGGIDHTKLDIEAETSEATENESATPLAEVRRMVITSLAVCTFYILVSSSMVFTNKALSFTYEFRTTNILLFIQMLFTIVFLRFLRDILGLISFDDFHINTAKQVAPVSIFYSLNAAFALIALRELSVPSYTLIKRLAPCFCIILEFFLLHKRPAKMVVFSLSIMTVGTILAAKADMRSTTAAWMLGFGSCIFQATYLTYVKRSGRDTGMSSTGILYYHSIMSLPCLAVIILAVGEIGPALRYPHWTSPPFLIVLTVSLLMGLLLNYALFLCTEKTSPTSTTVSGQVKAMGQTVIGMFTFGGVDMNQRYLLGTLMNISGGVGYAYSKYRALMEHGHG